MMDYLCKHYSASFEVALLRCCDFDCLRDSTAKGRSRFLRDFMGIYGEILRGFERRNFMVSGAKTA